MTCNTSLTNLTDADSLAPKVRPFQLIWQLIYAIGTVVPNIMVIYVVLIKIKKRTFSNMIMVSLACCDLVVGFICLPATIYSDQAGPIRNPILGATVSLSEYVQPSIGFLILILITYHRLLQLMRPRRATEKLSKLRIAALIGSWIFFYVFWILIYVISILTQSYDHQAQDIKLAAGITLLIDILFYILPILSNITMIIMTIVILKRRNQSSVMKSGKVRQPPHPVSAHLEHSSGSGILSRISIPKRIRDARLDISKDAKAVLFLITIIGVLIISQVVFMVTWPMTAFGIQVDQDLINFGEWISYSNSLLNPFILFIFNVSIRNEAIKLVCCFQRNRHYSE